MSIVFTLLVVAATVFAVVDIIVRDEGQIKHMPKALWLLLVILLPLIGVILWFTIGREYADGAPRMPRLQRRPRSARPPASLPAPMMPSRPRDTRTTEQQLADLEREIEEDRRRAELRRRQQGDQSAESAE
ncbi:hypothetical protein ET475_00405 [Microbacterium protaetiae]|uniref:Cardiolipin synthase N-terminal domain-containing protein n=1 Tax=Microbacterium protaetiae TaxID=2509458 RepID=A0A4P6E9M1_9MICO|nr:PLDc N-terminal domain-containing protein [Microbacterium protaetiae]QAY58614.1 hypothetical protein ET475_00405 [Microbacterium protaetiae]